MNFKPLVKRNLRHNFQKYAAYFIACSFCVMAFFLFSTLILNDNINRVENFLPVSFIITIAVSVFINFSIFFIGYAYSTFLKARSREFSLYLTQGMTNSELARMVIMENLTITAASTAAGLVSGTLLSKIFFLAAARISGYEEVSFHLRPINFSTSIIFFFMVFLILSVFTLFKLRRIKALELMKDENRPYVPGKGSLLLGIAGIILLVLSGTLIFILKTSSSMMIHENAVEIALNAGTIGLYMFLYGLGSLYNYLFALNRKYYIKNMLSITQVSGRLSKSRNIIFLLSVLGFAMIYYGGYGYTLNDKRNTFSSHIPVDIMYIANPAAPADIAQIKEAIKESGGAIKEEKSSRYLDMKITRTYKDTVRGIQDKSAGVISKSEFSALTGYNFPVSSGQCVVITNISKERRARWKSGEKAVLESEGRKYEFQASTRPYVLMLPDHAKLPEYIVVLQDKDYMAIAEGVEQGRERELYSIDLYNRRNAGEVMMKLKEKTADLEDRIILRNDVYEITSKETNFSHFLFTFISMLLLLISGCILYFNLRLEMDNVREVYGKLFKMGLADYEMKKIIIRELRMVFFIPLLLSSLLGSFYVWVEVVNDTQRYLYYTNTIFTILCGSFFYAIFYLLARERFIKEILRG